LFGKNGNETAEGIICEPEPQARYGMKLFRQRNCILCQSERESIGRRRVNDELLKVGGVKFSSNQVHQFVNKYEAILNCDAVSIVVAAC
jgi:hypothetical protein